MSQVMYCIEGKSRKHMESYAKYKYQMKKFRFFFQKLM